MVAWNTLHTSERILDWRRFRETLNNLEDLSDLNILKAVADYWAPTPRAARVIDYYTPEHWPTPWEMIHDNLFCESAVSLMMYYTLALHEGLDIELLSIYLVNDGTDVYLMPVYNNTHCLNYSYGDVTEINQLANIEILEQFGNTDIPNIT